MTERNRPSPRRGLHRPRRAGAWWQTALGVVLIAVAAYTAGSTYNAGEVAAERAECQARVNEQVVASLQVRDEANKKITDAQRRLITARLNDANPGVTPRQADRQYLVALDDLQKVRDANPIIPAQKC